MARLSQNKSKQMILKLKPQEPKQYRWELFAARLERFQIRQRRSNTSKNIRNNFLKLLTFDKTNSILFILT